MSLSSEQQRAQQLLERGDFIQSEQIAQNLVQRDSASSLNWKLLGVALLKQAQVAPAISALQKAVDGDESDHNAVNLLAEAQLVAGNLTVAERLLQSALSRFPSELSLRLMCARIWLQQGKHQQVYQAYRQILEAHPGHAEASLQLGRMLMLHKYPAEAGSILKQGCETSPDSPELLTEYSRTLLAAGNLQAAEQQCLEALDVAPDDVIAIFTCAKISKYKGDLPAALIKLERCLQRMLVQPPWPISSSPQKQKIDAEAGEQLMWDTLAQLSDAGVHAFPAAGTLLGLIREGGLLPFDKDIDLGLPFDEMEAAVACLKAAGWEEVESSYGLINPRAFFHRQSGFDLDLCGFKVEAGSQRTISGFWLPIDPLNWSRITEYPEMKLRQVTREKGSVWELCEPELWLEALYGDWRTPDSGFDTCISAKNLRNFSCLTQYYALMKLVKNWWEGNHQKALAIADVYLHHLPDSQLLQDVREKLQEEGAVV